MARRRGNGEGTVFQRADGRWEAAAYVRQPDGTRRRVYRYSGSRQTGKMDEQDEATDERHDFCRMDFCSEIGTALTLDQSVGHEADAVRPCAQHEDFSHRLGHRSERVAHPDAQKWPAKQNCRAANCPEAIGQRNNRLFGDVARFGGRCSRYPRKQRAC